jgi:NAD(P)-dependent dehydrogenase (short-subunit alcohol dehydrogenase family)
MANPFSIEGKRFFITGGTRGIGRAISLRFVRAGAIVFANYVRDEKSALQLKGEAEAEGFSLELCRADITSPKGLQRVKEAIDREGKTFDGMVHCAATGVHKPIEELTPRHFEWTFSLNVVSFLEIFKLLRTRLTTGSSVVAISSMGAVFAVPNYALIGSSKASLESIARSMAAEYANQGIRINVIRPGSVLTDVWKIIPDGEARLNEARSRTPLDRLVTSDEVACAAQFLCSQASSGMIGHTLVIDGGKSIVE